MHWDAIVVGAGICGLATAYELARRERRVLVIEAVGVGAEQSAGLARIFRIAHRDARLRELALTAREGWRRWERELGVHLLGEEGLVLVGGMDGFEGEPLDAEAIRARLPILAPDVWHEAQLDPLAGAIRVRRTLDALAARLPVRLGTVTAIDPDGFVWVVDERLSASVVVVCAGLGTQPLITPLGLDLQLRTEPHTRFTYEPAGPSACFISPETYGVPLGRTGRYAIGMHEPGAEGWVATAFPQLRAVGRIDCVSLFAPWLEHGDGFVELRAGRVIASGASNAMKFAPVIGERLAGLALGIEH
ncbi:NAD(P)/FAD-dependent oxidoreductase [Solirubrobacter deserti]|uniref:FAD-dependent oxidoreductase n=1 Tax=Solirubrobacter deserti TaxID=2282478 RepID=A0ABT4RCB7_9ACTN|nr:FAD-dependent oxidoreductase [Solirubrobacter deserti]MDA0136185.1 FAD-dependent oxidoreductase [Solirubrobacter deserti]